VEFRFFISPEDLLEAQKRHAGAFGKILSIFGALMIASGLFYLISGSAPVKTAIALVCGGVSSFLGPRSRARHAFKRDFANRPEVTATISESGIRLASTRGVSEIFWPAIVRFEETANLFIFYTQSNAFQLIPKRDLTSEILPALQSTLNTHLEKARLAGRSRKDVRLYILLGVAAIMAVLLIIVIAKRA
jgi:hypothetical protein